MSKQKHTSENPQAHVPLAGVIVRFKDLEIGDKFKIEGIYHTQVRVDVTERFSYMDYPYHSAEHDVVVMMNADPNMEVTKI